MDCFVLQFDIDLTFKNWDMENLLKSRKFWKYQASNPAEPQPRAPSDGLTLPITTAPPGPLALIHLSCLAPRALGFGILDDVIKFPGQGPLGRTNVCVGNAFCRHRKQLLILILLEK